MKKYLLSGLAILLPVALTFMIFAFLIDFFTKPFLAFTTHFIQIFEEQHHFSLSPETVKIIARTLILIALCILVLFLGMVARWFFFRSLIEFTNKVFSKIPLVKSIYKVCREIFVAFFSPKTKSAFKGPAMTYFTSKKSYAIGFIAGVVPHECQEKSKEKLVPIIVPTAPHPISGILMLVPENKVFKINMSNEDALKFIISCGIIIPQTQGKNAPPAT